MSKPNKEQAIKVPRFKESQGFYTTKDRSNHMSKIRANDTGPELLFRKALYHAGVRYRVNVKSLPGKPDLANISKRFVIFIDGEFWHGYNWNQKKERIKSNRDFWIPKIERNIQRDKDNNYLLEKMGFKVFRFWGHQIKNSLNDCTKEVVNFIKI